MKRFRLPDLGEGLQDAEIVAWRVSAGDEVDAGQPLVEVETDKAVVEVTSPRGGRIARIFGAPGDAIAVGAVLVEFEDGDVEESGSLVGELPEAEQAGEFRVHAGARVRAAPAVRERARQLGVDLASVSATGADGSVTSADVERAARGPDRAAATREPDAFEPLNGVRLSMARNMTRAGEQVVPATVVDQADVDSWAESGSDVSVRLVRAVAAGIAAAPALNASYDSRRRGRVLHRALHLAVAVQTEAGLFAPVIRDTAQLGAGGVRSALDGLVGATQSRSLLPEQLRGATFTLSNFGTLAGRYAALVVVPPQVGILGAGRIEEQVQPFEGKPAIRRMLPLSLTFDHRVVTGAEATEFLAAAIADLEQRE